MTDDTLSVPADIRPEESVEQASARHAMTDALTPRPDKRTPHDYIRDVRYDHRCRCGLVHENSIHNPNRGTDALTPQEATTEVRANMLAIIRGQMSNHSHDYARGWLARDQAEARASTDLYLQGHHAGWEAARANTDAELVALREALERDHRLIKVGDQWLGHAEFVEGCEWCGLLRDTAAHAASAQERIAAEAIEPWRIELEIMHGRYRHRCPGAVCENALRLLTDTEAERPIYCEGNCGEIGWTKQPMGRVMHKHNCSFRADPYCQTHQQGCPDTEAERCAECGLAGPHVHEPWGDTGAERQAVDEAFNDSVDGFDAWQQGQEAER